MTEPFQLGPLGQVSLRMTDVARAEAFYGGTLGLPHVFTFGDLAFFMAGDVRIYLQRVSEAEFRPGSILYFRVADIDVAFRELQARGVPFTDAPHRIHRDEATGSEEWMAFFRDSEGNALAIMARRPGAAASGSVG